MSSMNSCGSVAGSQNVRPARGGLPRPRRPSSRPAAGPASPRQRPAGSRADAGSGSEVTWGRAGSSWWKSGAQAASAQRRQVCRASTARVPTGNREVVRRALSPPATSGRGAALRRWSFRPTPSRLGNASSFSSIASPASPLPS